MKKHRSPLPFDAILARVQKYVAINEATGCHEWTAALGRGGYGAMWDGSRTMGAHRLVFQSKLGRVLTRWELVCHSCDNPKCVNPAHLWLGTPKANMNDMDRKGRRIITEKARNVLRNKDAKGDKNNMARLSSADVDVIQASRGDAAAMATRFGVTRNHIYKIRNGVRWPHKDAR